MMASLRSAIRPLGVIMICLMALTQAACAPYQMPTSATPLPPEGGGDAPDDGISQLPDMGTAFTIAIVVIGGVIIYKMLTRDRKEAEERTESQLLTSPAGCSLVTSADQRIPRRVGPTVRCGGTWVP